MLVAWRYKVCRVFARNGSGLYPNADRLLHTKPHPMGVRLYKPTKRKYDYVDYTGRYKKQEVEPNELTCILEFLGYIKFVEQQNEREA